MEGSAAGFADFEAFLEDISGCFLTSAYEVWRGRIVLPFSVITRDGPVFLRSDAAVRDNFNSYIEAVALMQLTLISRRPVALENCNDGTWLGTYETRLISHGQLATAPYTSTALLLWHEGLFKMTSILNGRGHHEWTGKKPMGPEDSKD